MTKQKRVVPRQSRRRGGVWLGTTELAFSTVLFMYEAALIEAINFIVTSDPKMYVDEGFGLRRV